MIRYNWVILLIPGVIAFQFLITDKLLGNDIFYHIKISQLIGKHGLEVVNDMAWFTCSTWSETPADLSFGVHILFAGLMMFLSPVMAVKIFAVLILTGILAAVWELLRYLGVRHKYIWCILFFFGSSFLYYRFHLIRPFITSILLTILAIRFTLGEVRWGLLLTGFAYSILYTGWVQLFIIQSVYLFWNLILVRSFKFKPLIYAFLGVICGLIIRPDFPNILVLNYQQIVSLLWHNLQGTRIDFGTELDPADALFIMDNLLIIIGYILSVLVTVFLTVRKIPRQIRINLLSFMLLSTFYFGWTLQSKKFMEYFAPVTLIYLAYAVHHFPLLHTLYSPSMLGKYLHQVKMQLEKPVFRILGLLCLTILIGQAVLNVQKCYSESNPVSGYRESALWLRENTAEGTVVFHPSWVHFARLFFHNDWNHYINGMDPLFMYLRDDNKYFLYRRLVSKSVEFEDRIRGAEIASMLLKEFNTQYIWTDILWVGSPFLFEIRNNPELFQCVYSDEECNVYRIVSG